jgi:hypothetical protein
MRLASLLRLGFSFFLIMAFQAQVFGLSQPANHTQIEQYQTISSNAEILNTADFLDCESEKEDESKKELLDKSTLVVFVDQKRQFDLTRFDYHFICPEIVGLFSSRAPPTIV